MATEFALRVHYVLVNAFVEALANGDQTAAGLRRAIDIVDSAEFDSENERLLRP